MTLTDAKTVTVNLAKVAWFVTVLAGEVIVDTIRGQVPPR